MSCEFVKIGLEGSLVIFLLTISFKIYKMKIKSHSKCCGENIEVETENNGGVANLPL